MFNFFNREKKNKMENNSKGTREKIDKSKRIKELIEEIDKSRNKALTMNKYCMMSSKTINKNFDMLIKKALNDYDTFALEHYYNLVREWDDYGELSLEDGKLLEDLINDDSIVLGIHRTGGYGMINSEDVSSSEMLHSIFENGLYITGDISSGAVHSNEVLSPNKNISPINDLLTGIIFTKTSYKNSTGGVIVSIPKDYVTDSLDIKEGHESDIYTKVDGQLALKPDYLVGFVSQKHGVCKYYSKDKLMRSYHNKFSIK